MATALTFLDGLDPTDKNDAQLKELVSVITKLAEDRLLEFETEMDKSWTESNQENLAPGVTKDYQNEVIHVLVSQDSQPVTNAIGAVVDSAFKLDSDQVGTATANFIKTLALNGFQALMGGGVADEYEQKQYIIYPDKDFICRCDVWMWRYKVQAQGFKERVSAAVAYRMQYGAVDITQVNKIALAHWFSRWNLDPAVASQILNKMNALIDAAQPSPHKPLPAVPSVYDRRRLIASRGIA